jgi:DNA-binding transcriptional regulator PaaX
VHAWRRFPAIDPALPRDLLPARWSSLAAARLLGELHQRRPDGARAEWQRLNGAAGAGKPSARVRPRPLAGVGRIRMAPAVVRPVLA